MGYYGVAQRNPLPSLQLYALWDPPDVRHLNCVLIPLRRAAMMQGIVEVVLPFVDKVILQINFCLYL
jgi:hypothetical protein